MSGEWIPQLIPGLFTVGTALTVDSRGSFHKILSGRPAKIAPLLINEIYWSASEQGVARGMHLQIPPFHGRKLVFATEGRVQDLVVDLRVGSPTYHQIWQMEMTKQTTGVFIPAGCAHGFVVLEGPATLVYAQEGSYNSECDTGVRLTSLGVGTSSSVKNMSQRDLELASLEEFDSPFIFDEAEFSQWESAARA